MPNTAALRTEAPAPAVRSAAPMGTDLYDALVGPGAGPGGLGEREARAGAALFEAAPEDWMHGFSVAAGYAGLALAAAATAAGIGVLL